MGSGTRFDETSGAKKIQSENLRISTNIIKFASLLS